MESNSKPKFLKSAIICSLVCLLIVVGGVYIINNIVEEKDYVSYGDNVRVSKSIAEGYEDADYIPRSVSINKRLKQNG